VWKVRPGPTDEKRLGNGRMIGKWPVRTSVLVDGGVAYFGGGVFPNDGIYICAVNAADGMLIWKNDSIGDRTHDLPFGGISPHGYLLVSKTALVVPSGRAMPAVFDRETGRFLYVPSIYRKFGGAWAMLDGDVLRAGAASRIHSFEVANGKSVNSPLTWFEGADMIASPERIAIASASGIYALDRSRIRDILAQRNRHADATTKIKKSLEQLRKKWADVEKSGNIDTPAAKQLLEDIGMATRELSTLAEKERQAKRSICRWTYAADDVESLIGTGNTIFVGGKDRIVAIDDATGREVWTQEVAGRVGGLAATHGTLVASTDTGHVYCFVQGAAGKGVQIAQKLSPETSPGSDLTARIQKAVDAILAETDARQGWCLVLDGGTGQLAHALAVRTKFKILMLEKDPARLATARNAFRASGLLGSRVTVEPWDASSLPDYFANLVVSEAAALGAQTNVAADDLERILRPCGGVATFGLAPQNVIAWAKSSEAAGFSLARQDDARVTVVRRALPGASGWTHQYADASNTGCSGDQLARGPLEVLWYGEPGPVGMMDRHGRSAAPVAMGGRMFVQGEETIQAVDSYNGTLLWKREIAGAIRPRADSDGGNLVLTHDGLYVAANDQCLRLDPATGRTVRTYRLPPDPHGDKQRWGFITCQDGRLYGSANRPLDREYGYILKLARRRGRWPKPEELPKDLWSRQKYYDRYAEIVAEHPVPNEESIRAIHGGGLLWLTSGRFTTWMGSNSRISGALSDIFSSADMLFALDVDSGHVKWVYQGKTIPNIGVALSPKRIFLVELLADNKLRSSAMDEVQQRTADGTFEPGPETIYSAGKRDIRLVVALDAETGNVLWKKPTDLTGCGGAKMGATYAEGLVLFYGAYSNHDTKAFLEGQLRYRRVTAVSAETGHIVWSRPMNHLRRPVVMGDTLVVEPRACDVHTGRIKMRVHPVSGRPVPFEFLRPGHSCGITSASAAAIFYRSQSTAIVDVARDDGLGLFGGIRPGCWLNAIPADGLVMIPEASSGCKCAHPIKTTVVLKPRRQTTPGPWTVFITKGPTTPVKHLAVNFGAPGDLRDAEDTIWFRYPRVQTVSHEGYPPYAAKLGIEIDGDVGLDYFQRDYRDTSVEGTARPWLFKSGCVGLTKFRVPVVDDLWGQAPARYTVRLGFIAPANDQPGQRDFDVQIQGKTVEKGFDIMATAGAADKAVVREYKGLQIAGDLTVDFKTKAADPTPDQSPVVSFIEVIREDELPAAPADTQRLADAQAEMLLASAAGLLDKKQPAQALALYHQVFDGAASGVAGRRAMEGMAAIGSPDSLGRIAECSQQVEPIMRNYADLDVDLMGAAVNGYIAVAERTAASEKDKANRMKQRAIGLLEDLLKETRGFDQRQKIVEALARVGVEVGADARAEGFVTRWHFLGPFALPEKNSDARPMLDAAYIPEPAVDLGQTYTYRGDAFRWQRYASDQWLNPFTPLFGPRTFVSAYAIAEIVLPADQPFVLKIAADDSYRCWLNGTLVGENVAGMQMNVRPDRQKFKGQGKTGRNTVLVKVAHRHGGSAWAFTLRVVDAEDKPIPGLQGQNSLR